MRWFRARRSVRGDCREFSPRGLVGCTVLAVVAVLTERESFVGTRFDGFPVRILREQARYASLAISSGVSIRCRTRGLHQTVPGDRKSGGKTALGKEKGGS